MNPRSPLLRGWLLASTTALTVTFTPAVALDEESTELPAEDSATTSERDLSELTTETTRVVRQDDGTLKLISHLLPVRTKTATGWAPIDTTLSASEDGGFSPAAVTVPTRFADAGETRLLSLGEATANLSMTWEAALPRPVALDATLTYPDVRPDVDLVMTAEPNGYSQALVIHTPEAASQLLADPVDLSIESTGLTLTTRADGTLAALGSDVDYVGAQPVQWDAEGVDPDSPASVPGTSQVHRADAAIEVTSPTSVSIALSPNPDVVADPDVQYPLYVDPQFVEQTQPSTLTVHSGGWNYYNDTSEPLRVGYCGWTFCTSIQQRSRSYAAFDITQITGEDVTPTIHSAKVKVWQAHSSSSAATPLQLRRSGTFSSTTNWPGPVGDFLQQVSSTAGWTEANPPAWINFENANLLAYTRDVVDRDWSFLRFAFTAQNEDDRNAWKKLGNTATSNPRLEVEYTFPLPAPKVDFVNSAVRCMTYVRFPTGRAGVTAQTYNLNGPHIISHDFEVWKNTDGVPGINTTTDMRVRRNKDQSAQTQTRSGETAQWYVDSSLNYPDQDVPIANDGIYWVRVQASIESGAGKITSPWSAFTPFVITTEPGTLTKLTNPAYPADQWGPHPAHSQPFEVATNSNAAGVAYTFNGEIPKPTATDCNDDADGPDGWVRVTDGVAKIPIPASLTPGVTHTLRVQPFNTAHVMSGSITTHEFTPSRAASPVSGITPAESATYELFGNVQRSTVQSPDYYDGSAQRLSTTTPLAFFDITGVQAGGDGYYSLGLDLPYNPTGATIQVDVGDVTVKDDAGEPLLINTSQGSGNSFTFLTAHSNTNSAAAPKIKITFVGKPATASDYNLILDSIHFVKVRSTVVYPNLQAAFDSRIVGPDGTTNLVDAAGSLDPAALADAGITLGSQTQPGSQFTLGTSTFTMPTRPDITKDSVSAAGQDITLPQGTTVGPEDNPGYVDFLVVASQQDIVHTPRDLRSSFTVNLAGESTQDIAQTATIPRWTTIDTTVDGITLPTLLKDGVQTDEENRLYVIRVPFLANHHGQPITSITLPSYGGFTPDPTTRASMHVLAMSVNAN